MRGVRVLSSIVVLWVLLVNPVSISIAQPQQTGVIRGTVHNVTAGGTEVAGVEITLHQYDGGQDRERGIIKTKNDGTFSFSGLSLEREKTYYLRAVYKGVEYYSQPVTFGDQKELFLDLPVYETTDRDTDIHVKMHHVFMGLVEGGLRIQEIMVLENRGDRVYLGSREVEPGKREVFRISLPESATAFEPLRGLMGCCILQAEDGFIDTMDIKPGRKEMRFSYVVDYGSSRYELGKKLYAQTESIDFLIPDKGIKATSDTLEFKGTFGNPGERFLHLAGKNLPKGSRIVLELGGLPRGKGMFKWGIIGLVIAIMSAGLSYPFMRKWLGKKERVEWSIIGSEMVNLVDQREEVLRNIAHLDDLFEYGEMDPEEYHSKRKQMMERAKEIIRQMRR